MDEQGIWRKLEGVAEMNYMNQIAKMLGVELEEEFYLESIEYGCYFLDDRSKKATFKLSLSGMMTNYHNDEWKSADECLVSLLEGAYTIVKKPWKPEDKEIMYYIGLNRSINQTWFNAKGGFTLLTYSLGNCFRTEEEAEKHVDEWMSKIYGENWKELLK